MSKRIDPLGPCPDPPKPPKPAHTPGPWKVDRESGEIRHRETVLGFICRPDDYPCITEDDEAMQLLEAECEGNADLVEATLDLYRALRVLLDEVRRSNPEENESRGTSLARAALAKAEGKQP